MTVALNLLGPATFLVGTIPIGLLAFRLRFQKDARVLAPKSVCY